MSKLTAIPVVISFVFVILALVYMPGTVTSKVKYVEKNNTSKDLKEDGIKIPLGVLSGTLCLLLIATVMILTKKPCPPLSL
jgi:uncharacterized membrane protein